MKRIDGIYTSEFEHIDMIKRYSRWCRQAKEKNTHSNYLSSLDNFLEFINAKTDEDIRKISTSDCRDYQTYLLESGKKHETVNAYFRNLKSVFNILVGDKKIAENPFLSPTLPDLKVNKNKKITIMTEEEILKFLGASKNPEDKFIFCLMLKTGVRREALCKIRTSDIEGDVVTLRAEDAKTHTEQLVAMTPEVCELYEEFLSWKERKFKDENIEYDELFISKMRRPYTGNSIWLKFKTALRNAGFSEDRISQLSPHKLRHTFVTNFLIENNGNIAQAQMAAGHSSPNTTARYNQMAQEIVLDKMRHQKRIGEVE